MRTGDTVGDYRVLEELGRGGEGRVFKIEHVITRRKEAMKVLSGAALLEQENAQRFMREIRVQASLNHPRIAAVHNAFWHGNELVMVMELVDGAPLADFIQRGELEWRRGLEICRQVLLALDYAHQMGVVHRDISPANIVIGPDGNVKLTDFGLAWTAADMRMTRSGTFMGSAHYMSPEQVRGAERADMRSDIYSCGVVLYEAVTGSKPFYSENAFQVMRAHVEQPPVPPKVKNNLIPDELEAAILKAMSKEPKERFGSARDFLDALEGLALVPTPAPQIEAITANVPAIPPPPRRAGKKILAGPAWILAMAAGVLLIGVTSFSGLGMKPSIQQQAAPPPPLPEPVPAENPPVPVAQQDPAVKPEPVAAPKPRKSAQNPAAKPLPVIHIYNSEAPAPPPVAAAPPPKVATPMSEAFLPPPPVLTAPAAGQLPEVPAGFPVAAAEAPKPEDKPKPKGFLGKVRSLNPFRRKSGEDSERQNPEPAH